MYTLNIEGLRELYRTISGEYKIVSPVIENEVLVYRENRDFDSIPSGYTQIESAGYYRSIKNSDIFFSYTRPYNNLKYFLRPPKINFQTVKKENGNIEFIEHSLMEKYAFFDVRRCDLKALSILDNVYLNNKHPDSLYKDIRKNILIVGVECLEAGNTCFCQSMDVNLNDNYMADMFITEIDGEFLIETFTEKAKAILQNIPKRSATEDDMEQKERVKKRFRESFKKTLNTHNLKDILYERIDHPYWEDIGKRCFGCTNCTQVCPTCFCFDIREENDLDLSVSKRFFVWDSCFNQSFATVHKFNIRESISHRYRQWLVHKMGYWQDQFGEIGCVGCGRCITWCPAKIDIQIETSKIREL